MKETGTCSRVFPAGFSLLRKATLSVWSSTQTPTWMLDGNPSVTDLLLLATEACLSSRIRTGPSLSLPAKRYCQEPAFGSCQTIAPPGFWRTSFISWSLRRTSF